MNEFLECAPNKTNRGGEKSELTFNFKYNAHTAAGSYSEFLLGNVLNNNAEVTDAI